MRRRAITRRAALIGLASLAFRRAAAADSGKADRIIVLKGARRLEVVHDGVVIMSFPTRLGRYPEGPKIFELDGRTPEGEYFIDGRSSKTPYHLALHISYPQAENVALATKYNLPPGGGIFIHGTPDGGRHFEYDWTDGCIAVTNGAIEEIWAVVEDGTPIEIRP